jgi:hypothetical protein
MVKKARILSEEDIDRIVTAQADNDLAWEKPIHVLKSKSFMVSLQAKLASRAASRFRKKHSSLSFKVNE